MNVCEPIVCAAGRPVQSCAMCRLGFLVCERREGLEVMQMIQL